MKATKTWIVIANSQRARILEREGLKENAHTVVTCNAQQDECERKTYRSPPGRVYESFGAARHQLEPHHSGSKTDQKIFAKTIARILETYASKRRFDRLVIVAAHSMLGTLRKEIGGRTLPLIAQEIDKDLVSFTDLGVTDFLQKHVA